MAGTSFPDTVQVLIKLWKVQDYRVMILNVLMKILEGLGPSSSSAHKDIYKCVKSGLGDKVLAVRSAAAEVSEAVDDVFKSSIFEYLYFKCVSMFSTEANRNMHKKFSIFFAYIHDLENINFDESFITHFYIVILCSLCWDKKMVHIGVLETEEGYKRVMNVPP